jgi:hypothetical protein
LGQPLPISRDILTSTPASCSGVCDGVINYTAEGGTTFTPGNTYNFAWTYAPNDTDVPTAVASGQSNPFVLNNACGGFYRVTVTDANGCSAVDSLTLGNAKTVSISGVGTNTLCANDSTGTITATVVEAPASGSPNYTFFWTQAGFTQANTATTSTYSDLPSGTYQVLAVDAAGCRDTTSITIGSPSAVTTNGTKQDPNCAFPNSGSINMITQGGTSTGPASYTYAWSPAATGASLSGLPVGTYAVTVSDLNGCTDTASFILNLPLPPAITAIDSVSVRCGQDGSITVTVPTALAISWIDGNGMLIEPNNNTVTGLDGGTYIFFATDANGCTNSDTITLAGVTPLSISDTTFILPTCFGNTDGSLGITVAGGNPNYQFNWSPNPTGQNNSTLTPIGAGNYIVTVTDAEGCTLVDTFALTQPPAIAAELNGIVAATCADACDGRVTLNVYYNTVPPTPGNFSFLWDDTSTDSVRVDLCAGVHMVTITDGNNCFRVDQVTIGAPPPVGADISVIDVSCNGENDGSMAVAGEGGNGGPYTYLWSNAASTAVINNLAVADSPNGIFSVTVTDQDGCSQVFSDTLMEPEAILVSIDTANSQDIRCFGGDDGTIAVAISGGNVGNITYNWENANGDNIGSGPTVGNLESGWYYVTVTDSKGCTAQDSIQLLDPPAVQGINGEFEPLLCFGDETAFTRRYHIWWLRRPLFL